MILYTAIFGKYEELKEPLVITPGWRYICYTDQDFKSDVWEIIKVVVNNPTLDARELKIMSPFDRSIWVDGSFKINVNLSDFWDRHFKGGLTVFPHPWRKNIGDEIAACIKNKRADIKGLERQLFVYRTLGLLDRPVIASGVLLRENTDAVKTFCEVWFSQMALSTRDQIGFAYAESMVRGVNRSSGFDYRTSQEFIYKTHFNRR